MADHLPLPVGIRPNPDEGSQPHITAPTCFYMLAIYLAWALPDTRLQNSLKILGLWSRAKP